MKKKVVKGKKTRRAPSTCAKPRRTPARDRNVAYHEAGHAIAHLAMNLPVRRVTIRPSKNYEGQVKGGKLPKWLCVLLECGDPWDQPRALKRCLEEMIVLLAGGLAVKKLIGRSAALCFGESDLLKVADLASSVVGIDISEDDPVLLKERFALEHWLHLTTMRLLDRRWETVEAVAERLLVERSLSGKEVRRIVEQVNPAWVKEKRRMSPVERMEGKILIAQRIIFGKSDFNLDELPPGERRLWQEVQREIKAGKWHQDKGNIAFVPANEQESTLMEEALALLASRTRLTVPKPLAGQAKQKGKTRKASKKK